MREWEGGRKERGRWKESWRGREGREECGRGSNKINCTNSHENSNYLDFSVDKHCLS